MPLVQDFKTFVANGNALDLAVGVIIGAAFGKVVSSLVSDILMPPLGMLLGRMDLSLLSITLQEPVGNMPAVVIRYGSFVNAVVDFLIVAVVIFILIRGINRLRNRPQGPALPKP